MKTGAVIVADDLTGACDTAAMFVRAGHRASVLLPPLPPEPPQSDIVALTTETRDCRPEEAKARTLDVMRSLALWGVRPFYKKIDSVLRGNIGPELAAMMTDRTYPFALVAPAFPAMGRTLRQGRLFLHGVPGDSLPERLRAEGLRDIAGLEVSTDATAQTERIAALIGRGQRILVADAWTDAHLDALAAALPSQSSPLLVGSAGLAAALARYGQVRAGAQPEVRNEKASGRGYGILYAVGSPHPVTLAQAEHLRTEGGVHLYSREIIGVKAARAALDAGVDVLLPLNDAERRESVWQILPELLRGPVGGLILCGGATSSRVLGIIGVRQLRLTGEVETGFPCGIADIPGAGPLPVVLKSGGFGPEDALYRAGRFLRRISEDD